MIRLALFVLTALGTFVSTEEAEAGRRHWRRSPPRCCPQVVQPLCVPHACGAGACSPYQCGASVPCAPCIPCSAQVSCLGYYLCPDEDPSFHWYLVEVHSVDENGNCTLLYSDLFRDPDPYLNCPEFCPDCREISQARVSAPAGKDADEGRLTWDDAKEPEDQDPAHDPQNRRRGKPWGTAATILNEDIAFTIEGADVGRTGKIYVDGYRFEVVPEQVGGRGPEKVLAVGVQADPRPYSRAPSKVILLRENTVALQHPHYGSQWFAVRLNPRK